MIAQRSAFALLRRRPNDVGDRADEEVRTAGLHAAAVRVEIDMPHRLPAAEAAEYQILAVRVNHICEKRDRKFDLVFASKKAGKLETRPFTLTDKLGVAFVEARRDVSAFE